MISATGGENIFHHCWKNVETLDLGMGPDNQYIQHMYILLYDNNQHKSLSHCCDCQ